MTTTIRTSSKSQFSKFQKYLANKKVFFTSSINDGSYSLILFDLSTSQTDELIARFTHYFHLSPKNQQEPLALAA